MWLPLLSKYYDFKSNHYGVQKTGEPLHRVSTKHADCGPVNPSVTNTMEPLNVFLDDKEARAMILLQICCISMSLTNVVLYKKIFLRK